MICIFIANSSTDYQLSKVFHVTVHTQPFKNLWSVRFLILKEINTIFIQQGQTKLIENDIKFMFQKMWCMCGANAHC